MDEPSPKREDRGPRIPLAKIQGIESGGPTISIFYRTHHNAPLQILDSRFPKAAAVVFCERIHRENIDNSAKSFTITGGDYHAFKDIFEWIQLSVAEGKCVNFKTYDEDTPLLFTHYAHAIEAADYLGIPARDFSEGLVKRLTSKTARDILMTFNEVRSFYDKYSDNGLREIAAASIFYAWWKGKLNEDDTPEQMEELSLLREEIPELDEDLHAFCERNEKAVREGWERKRKEKEEAKNAAAGVGAGGDGGGGGWDESAGTTATANGDGGGWDANNGNVTTAESSGWDQENINPSTTTSDWDEATTAAATPAPMNEWSKMDELKTASAGGADTWAEEVIQHNSGW